jgi:glycine/D-amino acid oxidase-like deaminating enzyme
LGLPPVEVSADRVLHTAVGLRPYRPGGFVLRTERLGDRVVVHNYGHGGAGITLSWGCATLAVEEALATGARSFAVLGCGVLGISTAILLQRHGGRITIYTEHLPAETASSVAGALWLPYSVYDPTKATPSFLSQFRRACVLSFRAFERYVGSDYGVRKLPTYFLLPTRADAPDFLGMDEIFPEIHDLPATEHRFRTPFVQRIDTWMIDPEVYLPALLRDFRGDGGEVVDRRLASPTEVAALPEPVILNCTGLGSRSLFGDEELTPIQGQLAMLPAQPEVDYGYVYEDSSDLLYMFPRKTSIVLGGTSRPGEGSLEPDAAEGQRILAGHAAISASLRG